MSFQAEMAVRKTKMTVAPIARAQIGERRLRLHAVSYCLDNNLVCVTFYLSNSYSLPTMPSVKVRAEDDLMNYAAVFVMVSMAVPELAWLSESPE